MVSKPISLATKGFDAATKTQDSRREIIKKALMPSGVLVCDLMFPCWELLWHKGTAECPENQKKGKYFAKEPLQEDRWSAASG